MKLGKNKNTYHWTRTCYDVYCHVAAGSYRNLLVSGQHRLGISEVF